MIVRFGWRKMNALEQRLGDENESTLVGLGLRTAACETGSTLDATTAECADGTPTTMRGESLCASPVQSAAHGFLPSLNAQLGG